MNLIFDLGGVVVRWDPDAIIAGVFSQADLRKSAGQAVFAHPDWIELDRGTLGRDEAIRRAAQRSGIAEAEIRKLLLAVPPSLVPFPDTVDLLYRLKARGVPLYCLSNMHFASIEHLEREHKFFEVFSGKVISCRLNLSKPENAIYEHALKTYGLKPRDTVFIDDVDVNVAAAAKLGIRTIQFKNAAQCERELRTLGIP
ncbi:MAG TPA: HAD family phosphatase, partial [Burkholderiales bacterium]|nr:HAD family phosphatase [Burkholderiales bacterium]